jgi:ubiquinone/menaquinone biosynthesis C-methylase UbiE
MKSEKNANVDSFNEDVQSNDGYRYTTNAQISSRFANERITDAILACADVRGKEILDVGCGDGATTVHLFDRGRPALIHGLDPAASAVDCARKRVGDRAITVSVGSAYELPYPDDRFDLTVLRVVLHHMDRPADALREALRVSRRILVVEPNGFNPVLKVLEKVSPYHRAHDEKSFTSWRLDGWVKNQGGVITRRQWIGVVPMFFPSGCARFMKFWEPLVERIPLVRQIACGQYVFVAERASINGKSGAMAA